MNLFESYIWSRRNKILGWTGSFVISWAVYVFFSLIGIAREPIGVGFRAVGNLLIWAVPTAFIMMLIIHLVVSETMSDEALADRLGGNMLRIAWLSMNVFLLIGYLTQAV